MTCTHFYVAMATPGWRKCIRCMSTMPPAAESIMLGTDESPSEPTTAEAFEVVRASVGRYPQSDQDARDDQKALSALALLERRMREPPSIAVLVEGFCQEVENAKCSRDARRSGGQTTGTVSPFEHVQPSVASNLERWARDFRDAMKT